MRIHVNELRAATLIFSIAGLTLAYYYPQSESYAILRAQQGPVLERDQKPPCCGDIDCLALMLSREDPRPDLHGEPGEGVVR